MLTAMTDTVRTSGRADLLSMVLEALPVGVWIMDRTGCITYIADRSHGPI